MVYSDFYFKSRNKLSLVLLVTAVMSIFSFSLFFFGFNSTPSRASKKILKMHQIVNLSSTQAAIFWQSDKKETGWVVYGNNENVISTMVLDERDIENNRINSYYHYVILRNLDIDKVYYYKIISGNDVVAGKDGTPFSFKTAKMASVSSSMKPAYGKVVQQNGLAAQNIFVVFYYPNTVPLLTLTKTTGEWLIPLQFTVNKDTGDPIVINDQENIKIDILGDDLPPASIDAPVNKTTPFTQTIMMGKDYKMTGAESEQVLPASTSRSADVLSSISIIFPREGAVIPAVRPLLKGLAIPGKQVEVSINSQPSFSQKIIVDKEGQWKIEVPIAIVAGDYKLTVITEDDKGKKITLNRSFSVAKSGEQILGSATSPATTLTPTSAPTPTSEYQAYPTTPPVSPTPPVTGIDSNIFMYSSIALIVMGAGFLIVF